MKIFISWSGDRSKAVATILHDWISSVLQASRPWISQEIDRGADWFGVLMDQLKDCSAGIICLTHENKQNPWILFEAGAIGKGIQSNRVCTLLVDLHHQDVGAPLSRFNHTMPERGSMFGLITTLNAALGEKAVPPIVLTKVFEKFWPDFEAQFVEAMAKTPQQTKPSKRPMEDMVAEILENTRSLQMGGTKRKTVGMHDLEALRDEGYRWLAGPGQGDTKLVKRWLMASHGISSELADLVISLVEDIKGDTWS